MTHTADRFAAWTVPVAIVHAAAIEAGCTDLHYTNDYVEADALAQRTLFSTLVEAVAHCQQHIASGADYWGQNYVYRERYSKRYGWRQVHRWIVTDVGIEDDQSMIDLD